MTREDGADMTGRNAKSSSVDAVDEFDPVPLFAALADRTRLRLINLMRDSEVCVCFFVDVLESLQPRISRHLAFLRRAGVVAARRDGKWMHYRLVQPRHPHAQRILQDVLASLNDDPEMRDDFEKLKNITSATLRPVQIQAVTRATHFVERES